MGLRVTIQTDPGSSQLPFRPFHMLPSHSFPDRAAATEPPHRPLAVGVRAGPVSWTCGCFTAIFPGGWWLSAGGGVVVAGDPAERGTDEQGDQAGVLRPLVGLRVLPWALPTGWAAQSDESEQGTGCSRRGLGCPFKLLERGKASCYNCSWVGRRVASGSLQSCSKSCLSQEPNSGSVSERVGAAGAGRDRDPLGLVCLLGKVGLPARL